MLEFHRNYGQNHPEEASHDHPQPSPDDEHVDLEPKESKIPPKHGFVPFDHLLCHNPASKHCDVCRQSKLRTRPHKRFQNQSEAARHAQVVDAPKAFLERICIDHLESTELGSKGEQYALVCVDQFSGAAHVYPDRDAVIAGMTSEADMMWKQAYFHNAIKTFKPLSHDLAVYDRTPEGEPNRSYEFLMKAARDYLERRRLEKMRQATKKSVSGKRDATPAPTRPPSAGKPTGICYDFQAGKCTRGKDCRYRHEKSDKGKGGGKKGKSRSKSRGNSRSLSPGSRNQVCKFWKAGECQRGNDCAFQHPPKPAAPSTKDDKRGKSQKKKKNKKKGDRSRSSSRGSNSSKGSQSLKDKGGKPSSSGSAAVCLMRALMMVAVVNPSTSILIACRKASPLRSFSTSILPCQLHPIALFHLGATMKSSKFP